MQVCGKALGSWIVVILVLAFCSVSSWAQEAGDDGPGCRIEPADPSVGADISLIYFAPPPSTDNQGFVGPLQLLRSGVLDPMVGTITLPLYRGEMAETGQNVWYVLTDTTDAGNAEALGLNFAPKLTFAVGDAVRPARLRADTTVIFARGTVDFSPGRVVVPNDGDAPFPPQSAQPGARGDRFYSPLMRLDTVAGSPIYNAPMIAFDVGLEEIVCEPGACNYDMVHDRVVSIARDLSVPEEPQASVTLLLSPGFSFARPIFYLVLDSSDDVSAALERVTLAPGLRALETGIDDSAFSAIERIFVMINGPTGCANPQRQGLNSALLDGRDPFNVLGGIPTIANDYSPYGIST